MEHVHCPTLCISEISLWDFLREQLSDALIKTTDAATPIDVSVYHVPDPKSYWVITGRNVCD